MKKKSLLLNLCRKTTLKTRLLQIVFLCVLSGFLSSCRSLPLPARPAFIQDSQLNREDAFFAFARLAQLEEDELVRNYLCFFNPRYFVADEFEQRRLYPEARRSAISNVGRASAIMQQSYSVLVGAFVGNYDFERGGFEIRGDSWRLVDLDLAQAGTIYCDRRIAISARVTNAEEFSFVQVEPEVARRFVARYGHARYFDNRPIIIRYNFAIDTTQPVEITENQRLLPIKILNAVVYEQEIRGDGRIVTSRLLGIIGNDRDMWLAQYANWERERESVVANNQRRTRRSSIIGTAVVVAVVVAYVIVGGGSS